jgi:hypothetical protein
MMSDYFSQAGIPVVGLTAAPDRSPAGPAELRELARRWGIEFLDRAHRPHRASRSEPARGSPTTDRADSLNPSVIGTSPADRPHASTDGVVVAILSASAQPALSRARRTASAIPARHGAPRPGSTVKASVRSRRESEARACWRSALMDSSRGPRVRVAASNVVSASPENSTPRSASNSEQCPGVCPAWRLQEDSRARRAARPQKDPSR